MTLVISPYRNDKESFHHTAFHGSGHEILRGSDREFFHRSVHEILRESDREFFHRSGQEEFCGNCQKSFMHGNFHAVLRGNTQEGFR